MKQFVKLVKKDDQNYELANSNHAGLKLLGTFLVALGISIDPELINWMDDVSQLSFKFKNFEISFPTSGEWPRETIIIQDQAGLQANDGINCFTFIMPRNQYVKILALFEIALDDKSEKIMILEQDNVFTLVEIDASGNKIVLGEQTQQ